MAGGFAGGLLLQQLLTGFEQLVEQSTGVHHSLLEMSRFSDRPTLAGGIPRGRQQSASRYCIAAGIHIAVT
ncbi:hypothetical protein D9M68_935900 [compost metagenome]